MHPRSTAPPRLQERLWSHVDGLIWSLEQNVTVHAYREFVPGGDLDCRLYIQVTPRDLGAGLSEFLANCAARGLGWRRVCEGALAVSLRNFYGCGEEAGA